MKNYHQNNAKIDDKENFETTETIPILFVMCVLLWVVNFFVIIL